jgi:hypothetical protein
MAEQYPLDVPAIAAAITSLQTTLSTAAAAQLTNDTTLMAGVGTALGSINSTLVDISTKQSSLISAMVSLQSSIQTLTGIQTQALTTQQLAVSDQLKNNQFQQLTTNTSRTAAGLPAIKLPTTTIADTIENSMSEALTVQASVAAPAALTAATTSAITSATSWVSDAVNLPAIWLKIKGLATTTFGATDAIAKSNAIQVDTNIIVNDPGSAPMGPTTV